MQCYNRCKVAFAPTAQSAIFLYNSGSNYVDACGCCADGWASEADGWIADGPSKTYNVLACTSPPPTPPAAPPPEVSPPPPPLTSNLIIKEGYSVTITAGATINIGVP